METRLPANANESWTGPNVTSDLPQVTFRIFEDGIGIAVETPKVKDSLTLP